MISIDAVHKIIELGAAGLSYRKIAISADVARGTVAIVLQDPERAIRKHRPRPSSPASSQRVLGDCRGCGHVVPMPCVYCSAERAKRFGVQVAPANDAPPRSFDPSPAEIEARKPPQLRRRRRSQRVEIREYSVRDLVAR
ncbi:hypothetical protein [Lacipirellula sp.]|uniref:hypothetical protein n=1 Tax=Lacipirellula sp. TaxID=2691419 RepID=UPI003D12F9F5